MYTREKMVRTQHDGEIGRTPEHGERKMGAVKVRGRFAVEKTDGWTLVDYGTGMCVSFDTKREAGHAATFARAYVKRWGGIDLGSFPYSINEPWDGKVDGESA